MWRLCGNYVPTNVAAPPGVLDPPDQGTTDGVLQRCCRLVITTRVRQPETFFFVLLLCTSDIDILSCVSCRRQAMHTLALEDRRTADGRASRELPHCVQSRRHTTVQIAAAIDCTAA